MENADFIKINSDIYLEIKKLISNKKKLLYLQKKSFKKPIHVISNNLKIIDNDRFSSINIE